MDHLTEQQEICVRWPTDKHLLIRGIPGSGKTTTLIKRAQLLQVKGEPASGGPKVLFLAYNTALAKYVDQRIQDYPDDNLEISTFYRWSYHLLTAIGINRKLIIGKERDDILRYARNVVHKYQPGLKAPPLHKGDRSWLAVQAELDFLMDEISWIKGQGLDKDSYLNGKRTGRGLALRREHREWTWQIYDTYQGVLKSRGVLEADDLGLLLYQYADRIPDTKRPGHVLIDEAQDFSLVQLRAIAKVTLHSLTIAADKGQSIYPRGFSWAQLGIDIQGRSKSLDWTFRSTRPIMRLAQSLQQHDPLVLGQDPELIPPSLPESEGPTPLLFFAPNLETQITQVLDWVQELRQTFPGGSIGVIVPIWKIAEEFATAFTSRELPWVYVKSDSADSNGADVKILTFYSAKGLEFDHVAVTSLREGLIPARSKELSEEDMDEFIATERRKLYVAITRARHSVALFASQPVSRFVDELDPSLYHTVT